jgi:hypothetical protein
MPITHSKTCAKPDGPDSSQILSSDWNAAHDGGTLADVLAAGNDPDNQLIQAAANSFGSGGFLEIPPPTDTGGDTWLKAGDAADGSGGEGGEGGINAGYGPQSTPGYRAHGGSIHVQGGTVSGEGGQAGVVAGNASLATGGAAGGEAFLLGGSGILDGNSVNGSAVNAKGGKANGDPGVVSIYSAGVTFDLKQAAHVADGSTVDQLRDALIAAGLMAAS